MNAFKLVFSAKTCFKVVVRSAKITSLAAKSTASKSVGSKVKFGDEHLGDT